MEMRQESAKQRIWGELEEALSECKTSGDMTNRLRVIELMGKFHQLWSDKVTISVETYEKMSEEHMHELLELSKLRHLRSGCVIDDQLTEPASTTIDDNTGPVDCHGIDTMLLQGQSDAIADDAGIPDVAGDSSDSQVISDNDTVSHETLNDNNSNNNDLQSNESDNPNATERTL
jgi:hypothetical protein